MQTALHFPANEVRVETTHPISPQGSNLSEANILEDWMSGLNQQFTKLSSLNGFREFESHILRSMVYRIINYFLVNKINKKKNLVLNILNEEVK
jgi:hypothetical protein